MPLVGMDTTFAINSLQSLVFDLSLGVPGSIALVQAGLRLSHEPLKWWLSRSMRPLDTYVLYRSRAFDLLVRQDLRRDSQEHRLAHYKPSRVMSAVLSFYP